MQTCRDAWNWAHGFSTVTSARAHAEFNKQYSLANPVLPTSDKKILKKQRQFVSVGSRRNTCSIWVVSYLLKARYNIANPNALAAKSTASVSYTSPKKLYEQYLSWCSEVNETAVKDSDFRKIFIKAREDLNIAMKTSKQGIAEDLISNIIKRRLASTPRLSEKSMLHDLHALHEKFHQTEAQLYAERRVANKDDKGILSICTDGADQIAHDLPKVAGRVPKDLDA
jgi:hypothetical protein